MTAYVTEFSQWGRVGRYLADWSRLTADTDRELEELVAELGLNARWIRRQCHDPECKPCPHRHYRVPASYRDMLVAAGVQVVDDEGWQAAVTARAKAMREALGVTP